METLSRDEEVIFAEKTCSMIEINEEEYAGVAENPYEAIGGDAYFNGSVDYECDRFHSTFTATIIVYHHDEEYPEGMRKVMHNMVPVWWEFRTWLPDGEQADNDFGFSELKKCFLCHLN